MKTTLTLVLVLFIGYLPTCLAQKTISERSIIEINNFLEDTESNSIEILSSGNTIKRQSGKPRGHYNIAEQIIPINPNPFLAFSISWQAENWDKLNDQILYRFYESNYDKGEWKELHIDEHADQRNNKWISQLIFEDKKNQFIELKIVFTGDSNAMVNNLELHFFSPGNTEGRPTISDSATARTVSCPCPQPNFENRSDWCPSGNCPEDQTPTATEVTHLIVHHSAGTNASSDWSGVVRSIWDYHVNVNNWDDIGYNWLVDPNGVLYEGRGDDVRGAHFCGNNTGTMGVCILGDFTNISPTDDAKSTLVDLLAWKSCDIDADPFGSSFHTASSATLNHIAGHKEGCSTECPGDTFHPEFSDIRTQVNDYIENNCATANIQAPSNLEGTVLNSTSIQLGWDDNSDNETNFVIERSTNNNSDYQQVGTSMTNVANYEDSNLNPNIAYFYRVKATNGALESDYSNELGIATVVTNTEEIKNELGLTIFPNPVSDLLNLKTKQANSKQLDYELIDYTGKTIERGNFKISTQVKMSHLPKGLYLLKINSVKKIGTFKVQRF